MNEHSLPTPDWAAISRRRTEIGAAYLGPDAMRATITRYVELGGWGPDSPLLAVTDIPDDGDGQGVSIRRTEGHWSAASAPAVWAWEILGSSSDAGSLTPDEARARFPEFVIWAERQVVLGPQRIHDSLAGSPIEI